MSLFFLILLVLEVIGFFDEQEAQADSAPLKKVVLLLDWYPQAENAGYFCAKINGFYRQAGFDVEIRPMSITASTPALAQVAVGQIQFCMEGVDQILIARSRGFPVKCIMASMEHSPLALMVHDESPVKSFADLEGRNVSVAPGYAWFAYILKTYHLQHVGERRFTAANANFALDPTYIQQCVVTSEPYFMQRQGIKVRTLMVKDSGYDACRVLVTSDQYLDQNRADVRAFVAASIEGWRSYIKDPKATDAEILRLNPQATQDLLNFSERTLKEGHYIDGYSERGEDVGQINPARMEKLYRILREVNIIPEDYDYRAAFL